MRLGGLLKRLSPGLVLAVFALASAVSSGSLADPIVEQDIVATEAANASVPAVGLALFLALVITASTLD